MRRGIHRSSDVLTWLVLAGLGLYLAQAGVNSRTVGPQMVSLGVVSPGPTARGGDSLDQMIGQMLIVGFYGQSPSEGWTRKLIAQVHTGKVGGVLLMEQNIVSKTQLARLTEALHGAGPPLPLLIAVDQEGGAVQRLGPKQGIASLPGAAQIASQGSPEAAGAIYAGVAAELKALGVNLNLGPVVDLARNKQSPIIAQKGRSFGVDPTTVSAFARAFIRAHRLAGVLTAAEHFPGHGSSTEDSHLRLIDLTGSWSETELEPYKMLIRTEPPPLVMVGHLHLDRFNAQTKIPASLSKDAIEGLLRREIGFAGAVLTDDLDMGAIRRNYRREDAAVLAIAAGADLVLFSNTNRPDSDLPERLLSRIRAAVLDGTIPRRRIEEAYRRISKLKQKLGMAAPVAAGSRSCDGSELRCRT